MFEEDVPALVTRSERKTAELASGTVYKTVSTVAEGLMKSLKYLFDMASVR